MQGNNVNGNEYGIVATYNENGDNLVLISESLAAGGRISIHNANGAEMGHLSAGYISGELQLDNASGNALITAGPYNSRGRISAHDEDGNRRVIAFVDSTKGGQLELYDNTGTATIDCVANTGIVNCKKVMATDGVEELYDGSLSSGSTTFNYGNYNLYIVVGEVRSGGSMITMTVPKLLLSGSDQSFCISDEADYITFKMKYSSTTATLTFGSRSSSGSILKVYGVN